MAEELRFGSVLDQDASGVTSGGSSEADQMLPEDISGAGGAGGIAAGRFDDESAFAQGIRKMEAQGLVDIGNLATWTASTYKQGYGVKELREDTPLSYWQSDGQQPHFITIHFTKKVAIERLSIYLNYEADESYTPSRVLIMSGSGEHDLVEVSSREFVEPMGWQHLQFTGIRSDNLLKCYLLKICFLSNHQNGKDSHVRAIKVMSPQRDDETQDTVGFTSIKLLSESVIR